MSEVMLAVFAIIAGFSAGYAVCDYRRWNREYEAWRLAQARRRAMRVVPPNGPWNNGRAA